MKVKLKDYIKFQEEKENYSKEDLKDLLTWISFFQHERLVHLIVTFFTGISAILFLIATMSFENIGLLLLFIILLLLFIPYIFHYYYLENGVQKLYDIYYDKSKKIKEH